MKFIKTFEAYEVKMTNYHVKFTATVPTRMKRLSYRLSDDKVEFIRNSFKGANEWQKEIWSSKIQPQMIQTIKNTNPEQLDKAKDMIDFQHKLQSQIGELCYQNLKMTQSGGDITLQFEFDMQFPLTWDYNTILDWIWRNSIHRANVHSLGAGMKMLVAGKSEDDLNEIRQAQDILSALCDSEFDLQLDNLDI